MAWTLQNCIDALKQEYPGRYPHAFVEHEGKYVFNLVIKGESPESAISDFHVVDPQTESISGGLSALELMSNKSLREKWKHANLVSHHDERLNHSAFTQAPTINGRGFSSDGTARYGIRRIGHSKQTETSDVLCHHGIKGQSWGVRNGPPYPLDQKTHNQVVKGATKSSAVQNNQNDGKTGSIAAISALAFLGFHLLMKKVVFPRIQDRIYTETQEAFNKHNKELSKSLISDIADTDKQFDADNPPKMISGKHSVEDDMAAVNPNYAKGTVPGTSQNCSLCSFTYDLRRRGYDVTALASDTGNIPRKLMDKIYDGAKRDMFGASSFDELYANAAKRYPEGARGMFSVFGNGMGHSMAWEIQGGKFVVIDAQRNVKVEPNQLAELGFNSRHQNTEFIRTDNLKVKPSGIGLVAAELKSDWKKIVKGKSKGKVSEIRPNNAIQESSEQKAAGIQQPMTRAERIRNLEQQWKKDNPNSDNRQAMKNWVEAQMNR